MQTKERPMPPSTSLASRAAAALALLSTLSLPTAAAAQDQLSLDVEAAYPGNDAYENGFGLGARFGHEWDLVLVSVIPEIGVNHHAFDGDRDADAFAVLAGGRVAVGFVLEPSVFVHAGVGHYNAELLVGEVSETNFAYQMGLALDFTLLPVVDFGAHAAYMGIAGDVEEDVDSFDWIALGGHVTFVFGDDERNRR
jgi:hypothetical protein